MKVLWVLKDLSVGGAERLLLELHPHVSGVEFVVLSLAGGDLYDRFESAGIRIKVLDRSSQDPRWLHDLHRIVLDERPDLIHAQLPVPAIGARLIGLVTRTPVVYTEQSFPEHYHPLTRAANALTFPLNDRVVAVSSAVERSLARSPFTSRQLQRVDVIRNAIDPSRVERDAAPDPDPPIPIESYGTVTHLTNVKGPDVLVEAAALVAHTHPDRRCLVVGDGPLSVALAERARKLDAPVDLLGLRLDARSVLARLDVAVFPSRVEGLPFAVLEAMALSRPIVASRVGGIPEAIEHGVSGILVDPGDPEALAEAIVDLLDDPVESKRLGEHARAAIDSHFDADRWAAAMLSCYEMALGRSA